MRAYQNGQTVSGDELQLAVSDLGFVWGVAVTERLRTFAGGLFQLESHMKRLWESMRIVGIEPEESLEQLSDVATGLAADNARLLDPADDLGMTIVVTPGASREGAQPTVMISSYPLPFAQWQGNYERGCALALSSHRQVPESCWPSRLKCRSRMHYYLADQEAASRQPGARALLLDQDGFVGEATTANVVMYRKEEGLVSPRRERILAGISLDVVERWASELEIPFVERDLGPADLALADEIVLTSTSPCIWSVTQLDGIPVADGQVGPISRRLLAHWSERVGVDIADQAARFSSR